MEKSAGRLLMIQALKVNVIPSIKALGFTGNFPHFRRKKENSYEFVSFQFSRYGWCFVIECGSTLISDLKPFEIETGFEKLNHGSAHRRLRLRPAGIIGDHWFNYENFNTSSQYNELAQSINHLVPQIETVLKKMI